MTERTLAAEGVTPSAAEPSPEPFATAGRKALYLLSEYPVLSQTFIRNEIDGLRAAGLEVDVVTVRTSGDRGDVGPYEQLSSATILAVLSAHARTVLRHPVRYGRFLRLLLALRGAGARLALTRVVPLVASRPHRRVPIAAVHTHFAWGAAPLALYAGALTGSGASITVHANDIYHPAIPLHRVLPRFDTLVTVCQFNVDYCADRGWSPQGMVIVPCGVEVPDDSIAGPEPRPGLVVSVGRLVPKKGFLALVSAFREVVDRVPHARLEIVGEGPERESITRLVDDLGLTGVVTLRGAMEHAAVLQLVATSEVFVLACEPESDGSADALPVAIREAMARSRPVVSTDLGGVPEALGDTGRIVRPGDVAALSAVVSELLTDPALARDLGRQARSRVLDRATLGHTVQGMLAVLAPDADPRTFPGPRAAAPSGPR